MQIIGRRLNMGKNNAAMNMAIDEAILRTQKEQPNPTLRFYGWTQPAFSFGYFQNIAEEVDIDACRADGLQLVKRMTGGGTVVHGWELTYTLILPRSDREISVANAYQCIGQSLIQAFQKLGIPARCYADSTGAVRNRTYRAGANICLTNPAEHDVMSDNNKKLAGISVRRNRHGIMFQGYISLDMPPPEILTRVSKDPVTQQMLREKSTAINTDGRSITRNALIQAISETFDLGIAFKSGKLLSAEQKQAETLVKTKYATAVWNLG